MLESSGPLRAVFQISADMSIIRDFKYYKRVDSKHVPEKSGEILCHVAVFC